MTEPGGNPAWHAFVTTLGFEPALADELGSVVQRGSPRWPAVITAPGPSFSAAVDPVFARQQLPGAVAVKAESVRALAEGAFAALQAVVDAGTAPFTVHAFVPDAHAYRTVAGRAALVEAALLDLFRERLRRSFRRYLAPADAAPLWPEISLIQMAVVGKTSLLVSLATPRSLPHGGFDLAPWVGGIAPVVEDRSAPSRAYGKLEEGLAWLGAAPCAGETCVDLGGSPGGWAWTALKRGARVTAVDRAPLESPAAGHPALVAIRGDAFRYEPAQPVDWLLCDVICEPQRTFELAHRWMERGWCRQVVATVKFKGDKDYGSLVPARARLAALGWRYLRLKHLFRHHNEVALLASRESPSASPSPP